jgi:hypothetical protein
MRGAENGDTACSADQGHGRTTAQTFIPLGAVPARESFAQIGESGYVERARAVPAIHSPPPPGGPEPDGAQLRIRRSEPDSASYFDVIVEFDDVDITARAYAIRCDREAPTRWPEVAVSQRGDDSEPGRCERFAKGKEPDCDTPYRRNPGPLAVVDVGDS